MDSAQGLIYRLASSSLYLSPRERERETMKPIPMFPFVTVESQISPNATPVTVRGPFAFYWNSGHVAGLALNAPYGVTL